MAEENELVAELRKQIRGLEEKVSTLQASETKLQGQVTKLTTDLRESSAKATDLEGKVGKGSDAQQAEIKRLTEANRGLVHRQAFREKIGGQEGFDPRAFESAWRDSGLKADTDEVDADAMDAAIAAVRESHPFYFTHKAADPAATQPPAKAPPAAPLGAARGAGGSKPGAGVLELKQSQFQDPKWVHETAKLRAEHAAAGTLRIDPNA